MSVLRHVIRAAAILNKSFMQAKNVIVHGKKRPYVRKNGVNKFEEMLSLHFCVFCFLRYPSCCFVKQWKKQMPWIVDHDDDARYYY